MQKFGEIFLGLLAVILTTLVIFVFVEETVGNYIPWFQNARTNVLHQTNQYQISAQSGLLTLDSAYRKLETKINSTTDPQLRLNYIDQQSVILEQMQEQASTLRPSQIPPSVLNDIGRP